MRNNRSGHDTMRRHSKQTTLTVRVRSANAVSGFVELGPLRLRCAIGRSGMRTIKREGDGATPIGAWRLAHIYYRADRILPPRTALSCIPIAKQAGWCDAVGDRNYNRRVSHPYRASAEELWRQDHLYDLVVVLSYNRRPRVQGAGSAIFMHVARPDFAPTAGCVALRHGDLLKLLARASRHSILRCER